MFNRIAIKLPSIVIPEKDTVSILLGYARNVLREHRSEIIRFDEGRDPDKEASGGDDAVPAEVRSRCLDFCRQKLHDADWQLLQEYHMYEPGRKIEHRKAMAEARHSTLNAIRLKVSRLMDDLRKCVQGCCRSVGLEA